MAKQWHEKLNILSSAHLKIIAMSLMTIDHIGMAFHSVIPLPIYTMVRILGRVAAPLFLFMVVEAVKHTSSRKKYFFRMYAFNIIFSLTYIPYAITTNFQNSSAPSMLSTYVMTIVFIVLIEAVIAKSKVQKTIFITLLAMTFIVPPIVHDLVFEPVVTIATKNTALDGFSIRLIFRALLPDWRMLDYTVLFSIMGVILFYCKNRIQYSMCFIVFAIISRYGFLPCMYLLGDYSSYLDDFFLPRQYYMLLALPFILLYSGKKGKINKYFVYIYYPTHIYVLEAISILIS